MADPEDESRSARHMDAPVYSSSVNYGQISFWLFNVDFSNVESLNNNNNVENSAISSDEN